MRSASHDTGPVDDLARLLRLRELRVERAEAEVRRQRAECAAAAAAVQARHREIAENRDGVARHARYTVGEGAADLPRLATQFATFRSRVDERLERSEYALIDDEEALESAQARLAERRQAWVREQSRRDGVDDLLDRSRRAASQAVERRAEGELDELRRFPLLPPVASPRSP